jgi:hypothetical protein
MNKDAIVVNEANFIIAQHALKRHALPDECASRNNVLEDFTQKLAFPFVISVAFSILCFGACELADGFCLHFLGSRVNILQVF